MTWCCEFVLPWRLKRNAAFPTYSATPTPFPRASFQTTLSLSPPPPTSHTHKKKTTHTEATSPNSDYNRHCFFVFFCFVFLFILELILSGKSEFVNNMMLTICVALASYTKCSLSHLTRTHTPTASLPRLLPLPYTHARAHTRTLPLQSKNIIGIFHFRVLLTVKFARKRWVYYIGVITLGVECNAKRNNA